MKEVKILHLSDWVEIWVNNMNVFSGHSINTEALCGVVSQFGATIEQMDIEDFNLDEDQINYELPAGNDFDEYMESIKELKERLTP